MEKVQWLEWHMQHKHVNCVFIRDNNMTFVDGFQGHKGKLGHWELQKEKLN